MMKTWQKYLGRAKRKVNLRKRQLDREVKRYSYWGARPASGYGQEHFNAALVNVRYWANMYALALADVEMIRVRMKRARRPSKRAR